MCQAVEGEQRSLMATERWERRKVWEKHESGEVPLSDEQITELVVEEIMARDAGF